MIDFVCSDLVYGGDFYESGLLLLDCCGYVFFLWIIYYVGQVICDERQIMFIGIVQGVGIINVVKDYGELRMFSIVFFEWFIDDIEIGVSVLVDGVCLMVMIIYLLVLIDFDVMLLSLWIIMLVDFMIGVCVNVEWVVKDGVEIGGYLLFGYVDFMGIIVYIVLFEYNWMICIGVLVEFKCYVFVKGYIVINGCSFIVLDVNCDEGWFEVWLIFEMCCVIMFDVKGVNDKVNIEIECSIQVVVDMIWELVKEMFGELNGVVIVLLVEKGIDIEELLVCNVVWLLKQ